MKRLYGTTDPIEAELLRALLRDAGIESTLDNQNGAAHATGVPTSVSPLGIDVSDEDAPAAADVLAHHFEEQQAEDLKADSEAPPLSDEKSDQAEWKIRLGLPRPRFLMVTFVLTSGAIISGALAMNGRWVEAAIAGGAALSLFSLVWFVKLPAEGQRKKPAP